jgi:hypothetical protein
MITISKRVAAAAVSRVKKTRSAAEKQSFLSLQLASDLGLFFATKEKRENEKKKEMALPRHVHSFFALSQDRYCALAFGVGAVLGKTIALFVSITDFCLLCVASKRHAVILTVALAQITLTRVCAHGNNFTFDMLRIVPSLFSVAQR